MRLRKERTKRKKLGNLTLIADKVNIVSPSGQISKLGQGGGVQAPKRQYQFSYNLDQATPSVTSPSDSVPPPTGPPTEPENPVGNALGRIGTMLGQAAWAYAAQPILNRAGVDTYNWMFNSSTNPNVANELVWTPMSQGLSPGTNSSSSGTYYDPPPTPRTQRRELLAGAAEGRRADDYLAMADEMMSRGRLLPPPIDTSVARPPAAASTPSGTYLTASSIAHWSPTSSPIEGFTPGQSPSFPSVPGTSPPGLPPSPTAAVAGVRYPAVPVGSPQSPGYPSAGTSPIGSVGYPSVGGTSPETPGSVGYPSVGGTPPVTPGSVNYPSVGGTPPGTPGSVRYPSVSGSPVGASPTRVNLASDAEVAAAASSPATQASPVNVVVEPTQIRYSADRRPTLEEATRIIRDLNNRVEEAYARGPQSRSVPPDFYGWPPEILRRMTRDELIEVVGAMGPADIPYLSQELIDEFFPAYSGLPAFSPIPPVYSPYTNTPTSPYLPTMYAGENAPEILSSSSADMSLDSPTSYAAYRRYSPMRGVRPGGLNLSGMRSGYNPALMGGMQRLGQVIPDVVNVNPAIAERIIQRANRDILRYAEAANSGIPPPDRGRRRRR